MLISSLVGGYLKIRGKVGGLIKSPFLPLPLCIIMKHYTKESLTLLNTVITFITSHTTHTHKPCPPAKFRSSIFCSEDDYFRCFLLCFLSIFS